MFGLMPLRVRTLWAKAKRTQKPPYRPLALSPRQEEAVCQVILNGARTGNYATQTEVLNSVEAEFEKTVTYCWLDSFLSRHVDDIRTVVVVPQEALRGQIPQSDLDYILVLIKSWVRLVPAELIFSFDETGLSDWEERKPKPVLISTSVEKADLHDPLDRGIRHQTLPCCVSASRDAYCPLLLCPNPAALSICHTGCAMELTFESKVSHYHISSKNCSSSMCVKYFFLQLKATMSFQDVEENR
jgi:hypothetical protein